MQQTESKAAKLKLVHVTAISWPHVIHKHESSANDAEDTASFDAVLKSWQAYQEMATRNAWETKLKKMLEAQKFQVVEGAKGVTLKTEVTRWFDFGVPLVVPGSSKRLAQLNADDILEGLTALDKILNLNPTGQKAVTRGQRGVHAFVVDLQWLKTDEPHDLLVGGLWTSTRTYALLKSFDGHPWSVRDFLAMFNHGDATKDQLAYWQHTWNKLNAGDYHPFREGGDYETKWFSRLSRQFPDLKGLRKPQDAVTKEQKQQAYALAQRAAVMKDVLQDLSAENKDTKKQIGLFMQFCGFPESDGDIETVKQTLDLEYEEIKDDGIDAQNAIRNVAIYVFVLMNALNREALSWAKACEFMRPTIADVISLSIICLMRHYSDWKDRILFYHMDHFDEHPINLSTDLLQCAYIYDSKQQVYREPAEWPQLQTYYAGPLAGLATPGDGWLGDVLFKIHPEVRQSAFVTAMGPFLAERMKFKKPFVDTRGDPSSDETRGKKRAKVIGDTGSRHRPVVNPRDPRAYERFDLETFQRASEQMNVIGPNIGKFMGKPRAVKMFRDS
jgi:hypothetical protein